MGRHLRVGYHPSGPLGVGKEQPETMLLWNRERVSEVINILYRFIQIALWVKHIGGYRNE